MLRRHLARIGRSTVSGPEPARECRLPALSAASAGDCRRHRRIGCVALYARVALPRPGAWFARHPVRRIFFDDWHGASLPATCLTTFLTWSDPVASVCDVCGKGPGFGNNVSHSHRRTPRRWNPNIQRVRAMVGKTPRRLNVCTSCIKAGKVSR